MSASKIVPIPLVRPAAAPAPTLSSSSKRQDGRTVDEFRPVYLKAGVVAKAAGSAYIELCETKVICAVFGPHPTDGKDYLRHGQLDCSLRFSSFAQQERRLRSAQSNSAEERSMSMTMTAALVGSIQLGEYPKSLITVNALVLQDGGGALAAAITCASLALADAGLLLYDLVPACSCALVDDVVLLDCCADELRDAASETTVAHMPSLNQLTFLKQDGPARFEHTSEALQLALDGCCKLHERMSAMLRSRAQESANGIVA